MEMNIIYDNHPEKVIIPDSVTVEVAVPGMVARQNERRILLQALAHTTGAMSSDAFFSRRESLLILVNDATRPTPTARALDLMNPMIRHRDVRIMVATGTHRKPTGDELKTILGRHYRHFKDRIMVHDARDVSRMECIGRTDRGTEVCFNRAVTEASDILIIGSVEPHYYAGYTGGRKALMPGVAAYSSVEQNHKLALDDAAEILTLQGNPVHEDMVAACRMLADKVIFSLQMVLDVEDRIFYAAAGDLDESLVHAAAAAESVYTVPVSRKAGVVLAVVNPPLDVNLYQAHKAIEHAARVLQNGGVLILAARCREGIGLDHFVRLLQKSTNVNETLHTIEKEYKLGYHKAARLARLMARARIWAVTGVDPEIIQSIGFRPVPSIREVVNEAVRETACGHICVIPSAGVTVPVPAE